MTKLLLGLLLLVPPATASAVSPVQKVLTMMSDMKTKGLAEKDAEIVTFKTFMQFCRDNMAEKENSVAEAAAEIEKLSADIEMYNSQAKTLGKEIAKLDSSADAAKQDIAESRAEFETEKSDYQDTHAEYETNIADIAVGTSQLKSMMSAVDGASKGGAQSSVSLVQKMVETARLPESARQVLRSFIEEKSQEESDLSAPEGNKFESQSGGVVDMMTGLTQRLEDQKTTLEQEFVKTRGAYQMTEQTLTNSLDQHLTLRNHKAGTMKEKESSAAQADADKISTEASKAEDQAFLKDLYSECAAKSSEYETNQKIRAGEVEAINKAIEIISGGAVSGASEKHLPALLQKSSFAQLRSASDKRKSQSVAASFLQAQGSSLQSRTLTLLSLRVAADPFGKVKKMIQDMVERLMNEANEEAEHKGFCDTELSTNQQTREEKSSKVAELTATVEGNTAKIGILSNQISELGEQLAEIDGTMKEALAIRTDEKAKNTKTVAEASAAGAAVRQALTVLQNYYEGVSLVQKGSVVKRAPVAQSGSATGVMGMLEVIRSDFDRLASDTKATEEANQKQFERFTTDSEQEKAVKGQHLKNKQESRTETDVANRSLEKSLTSTQDELSAANLYFEKLKPSCVEAGVSYEDRVNRRKEEIESLTEALKILDEQDLQ